MEIIRKALNEFREGHMSYYPENSEHEKKCDEIVSHMNDKDKEIFELAKEFYFNGQRDAWERTVD